MHESGANYIYPIYGFLMYSTLLLVLLYGRERMYEYLIYPLRKEIIKIFIERSFYHQSTQTPSKPGDKIVGVLDDYHKALMTVLMQKEEKRSRYIAHLARVFCSTPQAIEYSLDQRKLIVMREADKRIVAEIITLEKELHLLHRALIQSLQEYLAGDDKVLRIGNDFQVIENKEMKL